MSVKTFGIGSVAQVVLGKGNFGDFLSINFGWGLGVTFGCYVAGNVTGAHMNPAMTIALAVYKKFPWRKVPMYITAQMLGSFIASAVCHAIYIEGINAYDGGVRQTPPHVNATAQIWATYPQPYLSTAAGFFDQIVGTGLLALCVFALVDDKNWAPPDYLKPLLIGFVVLNIGDTFGLNCGYAINPARDFAPRLWTLIAGWGTPTFVNGNYWFWVPIVGPILGAIVGGGMYMFFIEMRWDEIRKSSVAPANETELEQVRTDKEVNDGRN
ncbi:uncharacterized protein TRIADDRAFT_51804 [Trichoplax adhaerens]|uniref:Aquaglyceroporin-3 n=1 Tax=Trichoplax adhaerens TaxID=10228 RepID=B3RKX8_TRIAD|nr:hypothetical protein TRIADDRAFT_51804 [Trichoplax adhaerens]EDV29452.1 hypothetical protein TRIADDRAFT_51804 [Trichoplax adhaerens]|eukprot:XP_002108654.1 hypothetical protein TRIADDRAFT_51804 [Trichoplax adhaerens]